MRLESRCGICVYVCGERETVYRVHGVNRWERTNDVPVFEVDWGTVIEFEFGIFEDSFPVTYAPLRKRKEKKDEHRCQC